MQCMHLPYSQQQTTTDSTHLQQHLSKKQNGDPSSSSSCKPLQCGDTENHQGRIRHCRQPVENRRKPVGNRRKPVENRRKPVENPRINSKSDVGRSDLPYASDWGRHSSAHRPNTETSHLHLVGVRALGSLLDYDKTRQCTFYIERNKRGYHELDSLVRAVEASNGIKSFMLASFDENGVCSIYPGSATLKKW